VKPVIVLNTLFTSIVMVTNAHSSRSVFSLCCWINTVSAKNVELRMAINSCMLTVIVCLSVGIILRLFMNYNKRLLKYRA